MLLFVLARVQPLQYFYLALITLFIRKIPARLCQINVAVCLNDGSSNLLFGPESLATLFHNSADKVLNHVIAHAAWGNTYNVIECLAPTASKCCLRIIPKLRLYFRIDLWSDAGDAFTRRRKKSTAHHWVHDCHSLLLRCIAQSRYMIALPIGSAHISTRAPPRCAQRRPYRGVILWCGGVNISEPLPDRSLELIFVGCLFRRALGLQQMPEPPQAFGLNCSPSLRSCSAWHPQFIGVGGGGKELSGCHFWQPGPVSVGWYFHAIKPMLISRRSWIRQKSSRPALCISRLCGSFLRRAFPDPQRAPG